MISAPDLASLYGIPLVKALPWVGPLQAAEVYADLSYPQRLACFLAQVGHESGNLRWLTELWGPTPQQLKYEAPNKLAARLGNTQPGDGKRFMGRGLIQLTGRANYAEMSKVLGLDLLSSPEMLALPKYAAMSAAVFWKKKNLNRFADSQAFAELTRRINGGYNGLAHRQALYTKAITLC